MNDDGSSESRKRQRPEPPQTDSDAATPPDAGASGQRRSRQQTSDDDSTGHRGRRWAWRIVKWGLCAAVVTFVALRAYRLWNRDELQNLTVSFGWLLAAVVVYLVGWIPSVWYWRRLMQAFGSEVGSLDAARAYYCGHLGKYVPGKAGVLLIRAGMMKSRGATPAVAAVTATVETLLSMGVGLIVGLALFPLINWPPGLAERVPHPAVIPGLVVGLVLLSLPVIALLLRHFAWVMSPRQNPQDERHVVINARHVGIGIGVFCLSWALHGFSLALILRAIAPSASPIAQWPMCAGAVSLATSVGFLAVFAPGGIGVREALLMEILRVQPGVNAVQAVLAAVLLRLVWLTAEILAAITLYYTRRTTPPVDSLQDPR